MRAKMVQGDDGPRLRVAVAGALVCLAALAAYSNSFGTGFPLDNEALILRDPRVHAVTVQNLEAIWRRSYWWPTGESGLYRPFTTLTYLFNYAVLGNGANPRGYHWFNFLLHAINALLVFALARRLLKDPAMAGWIAAVWAVHPVLTESVTNIVGRADLLAAAATLAGLWLYLDIVESAVPRPWGRAAALLAITALGVFSKESGIAIAGVIALYEAAWWKKRKRDARTALGAAAVAIPIAAMLWARSAALGASGPAQFPFTDNPIPGADFWTGRLTALAVMARYLALFVWPVKLSCDYSYPAIGLFAGGWQDCLRLAAVAAAGAATVVLFIRNRWAFFVAGFAFLTFLPASNLLVPIGTILAERLLYLPSVGLAALLALAIRWTARRIGRPEAASIALALMAAAFAIRTWVRNPDWTDSMTLARSAAATEPRSYKVHKMLAYALYQSDPKRGSIDAVIAEAERGVALIDGLPDTRNQSAMYREAGSYYAVKGDLLAGRGGESAAACYRRARDLLERALAIRKAQPSTGPTGDLDLLLSAVQTRLGETGSALAAAQRARDQNPGLAAGHMQVADALLKAGRIEDAAVALMQGMILTGDSALRGALIRLYNSGLDPEGCAVTAGPNGPAVSPACPAVHRHICAASVETIQLEARNGRPDLASQMKQTAISVYGCPAAPLQGPQ